MEKVATGGPEAEKKKTEKSEKRAEKEKGREEKEEKKRRRGKCRGTSVDENECG